MKHFPLLEYAIIAIVGVLYFCLLAPLPTNSGSTQNDGLNLKPLSSLISDLSIRPDALEHERLTGSILPIKFGLESYGRIPAWNPFLSNGVPLLNNPFNYMFNPFHSLPILLLGGIQGSKLALFITLLVSGYGMWALGYVIGLGGIARVSIAVLYMLNGSLIAKFGAGHFQLANSLTWPPLVFAALCWTMRSKNRFAPLAAGISFALLFYAGNLYYVLHTLVCCMVIIMAHIIRRREGGWQIQRDRVRRAAMAGLFGFGLSALQFFPVWQTRDFVTHQRQIINADGTLQASYDLSQSFINLITPWTQWTNLQQPEFSGLIGAVDYAYIGVFVFLLIIVAGVLAALRPAWVRQYLSSKQGVAIVIIVAPMLAILMMIWAGGQLPPFTWLYSRIPLLAEFRYVGRALAFAGLWWIVLGGVAVDFLWSKGRDPIHISPTFAAYDRLRLLRAAGLAGVVWVYLLIYSLAPLPTRLDMTLRNLQWWQRLDGIRFMTVAQAVEALVVLVVITLIIDSLLLVIEWVIFGRLRPARVDSSGIRWSAVFSRVLCLPLLVILSIGIWDVMKSNAAAIQFVQVNDSFDNIYEVIHGLETGTAFPAVKLPFTARSFSAYESQIRNWGVNEGWLPAAPPGLLADGQTISNLPRWGLIVRDKQGAIPVERDVQFLDESGYYLHGCYQAGALTATECTSRPHGVMLYENSLALPYAFVITGEQLVNQPNTVNGAVVQAVDVISHQMDSITLKASASDDADYWLVVQESNFPGWRAAVDGVELPISTVQTGYKDEQQLGLMAVRAATGEHTYTFHFEAPGLRTGIIVFWVTVITSLIYLYWGRRAKSKLA